MSRRLQITMLTAALVAQIVYAPVVRAQNFRSERWHLRWCTRADRSGMGFHQGCPLSSS